MRFLHKWQGRYIRSILLFYVAERQDILVILLARNSTSSLFFFIKISRSLIWTVIAPQSNSRISSRILTERVDQNRIDINDLE